MSELNILRPAFPTGHVQPATKAPKMAETTYDPILMTMLSYWEELRADRIAPLRSELNPEHFATALDHTFVLECNGIEDIRFRLAGRTLTALMGMELRGMPARALIAPEDRDHFFRALADLITDPKITVIDLFQSDRSKPHQTGRMLLLPLQNRNGEITRLLGCLSTTVCTGVAPQRFAIADIHTTRVVSQAQKPITASLGFAETQTPFAPKNLSIGPNRPAPRPTKTKRLGAPKPHLRLVKND